MNALPSSGHEAAARAERRWAFVSIGLLVVMLFLAAFAGIHQAIMPQLRVETVDPRTLHIAGEFVEANLGSVLEPQGTVTVRLVAQQYSFTPQCIVVPADTPIVFRGTSADVVHGFLVEGSNINAMLIPGYVTQLSGRFRTLGDHMMPCHEFCGVGHQGMWAHIKVIDPAAFSRLAGQQRRVSCVTE